MKKIDKLRNMTTDELAEYLDGTERFRDCNRCFAHTYCLKNTDDSKACKEIIKDYLESEVTE